MTIDTERHILEKGAELVRRIGFHKTGLSMILKAAGVEDVVSLAKFVVNSWQGALIALKITGNAEPLMIFERFIFDELLKPKTPDAKEINVAEQKKISWELSRISH